MERKKAVNTTTIELIIFFLIAYGVNFLLGFSLMIHRYIDPTIFAGFMGVLPAIGALLARQYKKEDISENESIRNILIGVGLIYLVMILLHALGIIKATDDKMTFYVTQMATMIGSIMIVRRARDQKEDRRLFDHFESVKTVVYLWVILLAASNLISSLSSFSTTLFTTVVFLIFMPLQFWASAIGYFGEEYAWRGYLQEKMQHRFGKRIGVVLLGVLWELWHMPLWFTAYHLEMWEIPFRFAVAISMSVFLGYIFMKTKNVWVCSLVHCIYNIIASAVPRVAATVSTTAVGQVLPVFRLSQEKVVIIKIVLEIATIIMMASFAFAKEYRRDVNNSEQLCQDSAALPEDFGVNVCNAGKTDDQDKRKQGKE